MALSMFGVGVINGELYAVGSDWIRGIDASVEHSTQIIRYNPGRKVWTHIASKRSNRDFAAIGVLGNAIYVIGGIHATPCSCEKYDVSSNTWSTIASKLHTISIMIRVGVFKILYELINDICNCRHAPESRFSECCCA